MRNALNDKLISRALALVACSGLMACASKPKADLPADANPQAEMQKVESEMAEARAKQFNKLSPTNFAEAQDSLANAKKKIDKGAANEKILNDIAISKGYMERVETVGEKNSAIVAPIMTARQNALNARADSMLGRQFAKVDEDFADMGHEMEESRFKLKADKASALERKYQDLELEALKMTNLGEARTAIERAGHDGAHRRAPQTFEMAKTQYNSAERAIAENRRNPQAYQSSVDEALKGAHKLQEVVNLSQRNNISEAAALTMWNQQQQITSSQSSIARLESQSREQQEKLRAQMDEQKTAAGQQQAAVTELQNQNTQYAEQEQMRQKIETLRSGFGKDEAEVLKDGKNLIVRLKQMDFASGHADLNPKSFATLKKVEDLIAAVPVQKITIEGHTDASGSPKANKELSTKRADAVKQYLVSQGNLGQDKVDAEGFGSEKPISSNKTKTGRKNNRRVDVVIETTTVL